MDREEGPCAQTVHAHSEIKSVGSSNTRIPSMNSGNSSSANSSPTNNGVNNRKRQRIFDLQSPWSTPNSFSCVHLGSSNSSSLSSGAATNLEEEHSLIDDLDTNDKQSQALSSLHSSNAHSSSISSLPSSDHHRNNSMPNFLSSSSSSSSSFASNNLGLSNASSGTLIQSKPPGATKGRRKIDITYIKEKNRRHITFSKRKAGIVKKANELSTLTGTDVFLLIASEAGTIYYHKTDRFKLLIDSPEAKLRISECLHSTNTNPSKSQPSDYKFVLMNPPEIHVSQDDHSPSALSSPIPVPSDNESPFPNTRGLHDSMQSPHTYSHHHFNQSTSHPSQQLQLQQIPLHHSHRSSHHHQHSHVPLQHLQSQSSHHHSHAHQHHQLSNTPLQLKEEDNLHESTSSTSSGNLPSHLLSCVDPDNSASFSVQMGLNNSPSLNMNPHVKDANEHMLQQTSANQNQPHTQQTAQQSHGASSLLHSNYHGHPFDHSHSLPHQHQSSIGAPSNGSNANLQLQNPTSSSRFSNNSLNLQPTGATSDNHVNVLDFQATNERPSHANPLQHSYSHGMVSANYNSTFLYGQPDPRSQGHSHRHFIHSPTPLTPSASFVHPNSTSVNHMNSQPSQAMHSQRRPPSQAGPSQHHPLHAHGATSQLQQAQQQPPTQPQQQQVQQAPHSAQQQATQSLLFANNANRNLTTGPYLYHPAMHSMDPVLASRSGSSGGLYGFSPSPLHLPNGNGLSQESNFHRTFQSDQQDSTDLMLGLPLSGSSNTPQCASPSLASGPPIPFPSTNHAAES